MNALALAVGVVGLSFAAVLAIAFRYLLVESRRLDATAASLQAENKALNTRMDGVKLELGTLRDDVVRLDNRSRTLMGPTR